MSKVITLSNNCLCGGLASVNADLRQALVPYGYSVEWVVSGSKFSKWMQCPDNPGELGFGHWVGKEASDSKAISQALYDFIIAGNYKLVIANVLGGIEEANLMRFLPRNISRVMLVHNISRGTYRFARSIRDHVHATVGVSPRIRDDLVTKYGFPSKHTFAIPNAVDVSQYSAVKREGNTDNFRILSLGRLEDQSKGIFLLPKIVKLLGNLPWHLTVAGDGPDRSKLEALCAPISDRVTFLGQARRNQVPGLFASHDCLIMPSHYEGFGLTIVEAMAAGCVPVVSRIRGVTDFIIQDGSNGMLFKIGDTHGAAECLRSLMIHPEIFQRLGAGAYARARDQKFTLAGFGKSYANLFNSLKDFSHSIIEPTSMEQWNISSTLANGSPLSRFPFAQRFAKLYYKFR